MHLNIFCFSSIFLKIYFLIFHGSLWIVVFKSEFLGLGTFFEVFFFLMNKFHMLFRVWLWWKSNRVCSLFPKSHPMTQFCRCRIFLPFFLVEFYPVDPFSLTVFKELFGGRGFHIHMDLSRDWPQPGYLNSFFFRKPLTSEIHFKHFTGIF